MSRSRSSPSGVLVACDSAVPAPSQPVSMRRICVQPNPHGIARMPPMPGVAPGRYAGREPKRAFGQLVDRRRRAEEREQRLVLVHEIAVHAERRVAQLAHRAADTTPSPRRSPTRGHSVNSCSSAPASVTSRVRSATGRRPNCCADDLALLGDLDAAVHRARRQRGERAVHRRAAAASDAAAAAVKESQRRRRLRANSFASASCAL